MENTKRQIKTDDHNMAMSLVRLIQASAFSEMFLSTIREIRKKQWESDTQLIASSDLEMRSKMNDFIRTRRKKSAAILEERVDEFVREQYEEDVNYIFFDPKWELAHYQVEHGDDFKAEIDYFEEVGRMWNGDGSDHQTSTRIIANECIKVRRRSKYDYDFPKTQVILFLIHALVMLFIGGSLAPVVPDLVGQWIPTSDVGPFLNLGCIVYYFIGAAVMSVMLLNAGSVARFIGKLEYIEILGTVVLCVVSFFGWPDRPNSIYYELLALYSGLLSVATLIDGIVGKIEYPKLQASARQEFVDYWKEHRKHFGNYVDLHSAWWKDCYADKPEPSFLQKMRLEYMENERDYQNWS